MEATRPTASEARLRAIKQQLRQAKETDEEAYFDLFKIALRIGPDERDRFNLLEVGKAGA